jgi:hypothetical protein
VRREQRGGSKAAGRLLRGMRVHEGGGAGWGEGGGGQRRGRGAASGGPPRPAPPGGRRHDGCLPRGSPPSAGGAAAREGGGAGRGASVRAQAISSRAHTPSDVGADRIDNKLSIPLWKQVDALVEMPKHW